MKKIVIPIDFTTVSDYGLNLAVKIAAQNIYEIHLLHVINLPSHILLTNDGEILEDGEMDSTIPLKEKELAILKLKQLADSLPYPTVSKVCFGHVNEEVVNYANSIEAALIVLGTHGAHGIKEIITGSHAEYVAMHAHAPVLTIKSTQYTNFNKLLLAGSFKQDDIPHCDIVIDLHKTFDAKLYLLRVNTSSDFLSDKEAYLHMQSFVDEHKLGNVEFAIFNDHNLEDGIIHFAAQKEINLLAIGSMQRTGLNKFIHGCVSADLVNHINKPLLTFKLK